MSSPRRAVLTAAVVVLLGAGAAGANLALLRSTQDSSDPVGRLSPRAVFPAGDTSTGPSVPQAGPSGTEPDD